MSVEAIVEFGEPGPITPLTGSKLVSVGGLYQHCLIRNRFESDKHIYMMGITSPGGFQSLSVAFVQIASPTLLWIADWTISALGGKPLIPDPVSKDPNWVLLDEHQEPGMPVPNANGAAVLYRHSGTYIYGHKNPAKQTLNNINYSRPPWLNPAVSRTVDVSQLDSNLIAAIAGSNASPQQQVFANTQNQ